jgi:glycosyltransferase involved in cell wall biosynthesis
VNVGATGAGGDTSGAEDLGAGEAVAHPPERLGFACAWMPNHAETWSGTPFRLRAALADDGPLVDVGVELPRPVATALKAAYARRIDGRWTSTWRHEEPTRRLLARALRSGIRGSGCDAVVMIQDLARLPVPYLVVQDLSYDVLLDSFGPDGVPHFRGLDRQSLVRLRDRQRRIYDDAVALLPMSRWLGEQLVASGLPRSKVIPVHPGVNVPVAPQRPVPQRRRGSQRRLLLIGRDPHTKGADIVVQALALLRRDLGPDITLTLAGLPPGRGRRRSRTGWTSAARSTGTRSTG